jgi:hypothetical protein
MPSQLEHDAALIILRNPNFSIVFSSSNDCLTVNTTWRRFVSHYPSPSMDMTLRLLPCRLSGIRITDLQQRTQIKNHVPKASISAWKRSAYGVPSPKVLLLYHQGQPHRLRICIASQMHVLGSVL